MKQETFSQALVLNSEITALTREITEIPIKKFSSIPEMDDRLRSYALKIHKAELNKKEKEFEKLK